MVTLPFRNRADAARQLAAALVRFRGSSPVVLAIPRGGVPVGRVVADALGGELDVVLVKKIGAPGRPEVAIGAVDERGNVALNRYAGWVDIDAAGIRAQADRLVAAMRDRRLRYCGARPPVPLHGRVAIVVDDGMATGATMAAALREVRRQGAAEVVCAVPVAAHDALPEAEALADMTVCLATPAPFLAVGYYYLDFAEVDDAAVIEALRPPSPGDRRDS